MYKNMYWKQAEEELAYLSSDPGFQRLVEARAVFLMDQATYKKQCKREGLAEGRTEGLKEGKKLKQFEIAKKLKSKKFSIEEISEITGLSKEDIEKL